MIVDIEGLKEFINDIGIKQNVIAGKSGITDPQLTLILQGKRKLEAGEYASICKVLNVPMTKFVKDNPRR